MATARDYINKGDKPDRKTKDQGSTVGEESSDVVIVLRNERMELKQLVRKLAGKYEAAKVRY